MFDIVIGVDPGRKGAMAVMKDGQPVLMFGLPYRKGANAKYLDARQLASMLSTLPINSATVLAIIEKPLVFARNGTVAAQTGGMNVGMIEGVLTTFGAQVQMVEPARWVREVMGKNHGQLKGEEMKRGRLVRAQLLYPQVDIKESKTQDHADALLIAHYGWSRRSHFEVVE